MQSRIALGLPVLALFLAGCSSADGESNGFVTPSDAGVDAVAQDALPDVVDEPDDPLDALPEAEPMDAAPESAIPPETAAETVAP